MIVIRNGVGENCKRGMVREHMGREMGVMRFMYRRVQAMVVDYT